MAEEEPTKIIDVSHPKDVRPPATSKPVIVGHTNIVQRDPMMSPSVEADSSDNSVSDTTLQSKPKRELNLQPLSESETASEDQSLGSEGENPPKSNTDQPTDTENNGDTSDGAINATLEGINTKKEAAEAKEREEKATREINGLVNSKKYFVKINDTPQARNTKIFLWLIILILIAGAGWYFGIGPGKDSLPGIDKTPKSSSLSSQPQATASQQPTEKSKSDELISFTNPDIKLTFLYPKNWQTDVAKDDEHDTRDVITLSSPADEIDLTNDDGSTSKVGVYLRAKIFAENTKNPLEYKTDIVSMTNCNTEDIVVNNTPLKLAYLEKTKKAPNISQVSIVTDNCTLASNDLFGANDQLQFSSKSNTYVIYAEYVYTKDYLNHQGINDEDVIKTAQATGVITTEDAFKSGGAYKQFTDILKTLKEVQD